MKNCKVEEMFKLKRDELNTSIENKKVIEVVNTLMTSFDMKYTVLYQYEDFEPFNSNEYKVTFMKHCGTNGKENSIKNSLLEIFYLMHQLEQYKAVTWVQVLDINIDNLDDVYDFVITFILDENNL